MNGAGRRFFRSLRHGRLRDRPGAPMDGPSPLPGRGGWGTEYALGPDSQGQPGVPQGKVTKHTWTSKIFPGTVRDYWVYVPAQYDADKPACVMVFQDGGGYVERGRRACACPIVFDNLIHKGDMPVTIGIFINPGVLPAR